MKRIITISALALALIAIIPGIIFCNDFLSKKTPRRANNTESVPSPAVLSYSADLNNLHKPLLSLNPAYRYSGAFFTLRPVEYHMPQLQKRITFRSGNSFFLLPQSYILPTTSGLELPQQGVRRNPDS